MKRWTRRTLAAAAGLILGWCAAGFLPGSLSHSAAQAQDHAPAATAADAHAATDAHQGHGQDEGQKAASQLVPQASQVTWYRLVVFGAAGLFVAAIVLGIPALKLRTPEPPEAADAAGHH